MDRKRLTPSDSMANGRADIWLTRSAYQKPAVDTSLHQRGSIRKAPACDIFVKSGKSYVIASRIHDLSIDGVFVEIEPAGILEGDRAEVMISFNYQGQQIEHLIPADVVRIQSDGVGLKFGRYSDRTYTDLVNLLYTK